MQRTIRLKLNPTIEQSEMLLETLRQYAACFNAVASYGWEHSEKNGVKLHRATYYDLRAQYPELPSQLVIASRVKATEAVKSALVLRKKGHKTSCPSGTLVPIRYDARTYNIKQEATVVSLSSTAGREKVAFSINPHANSILVKATGFDSADLIYRQGAFWLHVVVTIPDVEFESSGDVIGVDLGLNRPAVCSNNQFFGEKRWKNIDRRYFRLKRSLQAKGTKSAKRHLKRLGGKVNRFRRDCDHVLSRRIVDSVQPGSVISAENLVNIRARVRQHGRNRAVVCTPGASPNSGHSWGTRLKPRGARLPVLTLAIPRKSVLVAGTSIAPIAVLNHVLSVGHANSSLTPI